MIYVISYTDDKPAFLVWAAANVGINPAIRLDLNGEPKVSLRKVPTFTNGTNSVSLVEVESLTELDGAPVEVLATGASPAECHAIIAADPILEAKVRTALPDDFEIYTPSIVNGVLVGTPTGQFQSVELNFGEFVQ